MSFESVCNEADWSVVVVVRWQLESEQAATAMSVKAAVQQRRSFFMSSMCKGHASARNTT
jgi:hypothetical protein